MQFIDIHFPIVGRTIAVDHGYALFASICRVLPEFHSRDDVGLALVRGKYLGNGLLSLNKLSGIRIRLPDDSLPDFIGLSGNTLIVDGSRLTLCTPTIYQIIPRTALYSHIVTTKNGNDEQRFLTAIKEQMDALDIQREFFIGRRKTFKVSGKQIVGYSLLVTGLTADESISLQEHGLGGRRKMGCGIFIGIR